MASVFFDPNFGGDGLTVNDGSQPTPGGLGNGGHRTLFVPALNNVVNVASFVKSTAEPVGKIFLPPAATDYLTKLDLTPLTGGEMYFNTASQTTRIYKSGSWTVYGGGGAVGGGTDQVFYENGQTVNTSYTLGTGRNAVSAGAVNIASGVIVTIPSGASWAVV